MELHIQEIDEAKSELSLFEGAMMKPSKAQSKAKNAADSRNLNAHGTTDANNFAHGAADFNADNADSNTDSHAQSAQNFAAQSVENILTNAAFEATPGAKIVAFGVGGGGTNMISHLAKSAVAANVKLVAANTDAQHLGSSLAHEKIQLGKSGLGAGMDHGVGEKAAMESSDEIRAAVAGADMVFITAGLGGGTGTGAAPVVARIAKEEGALTVAIVTKPFKYEGSKKSARADEGLKALREFSDSLIVVPNEKIMAIIPKGCGFKDSFKIVDDVLTRAVEGISGMVINHGENDMNIDFADLKTVMKYKGLALMGIGESSSDNAAVDAVNEAIHSPLFNDLSIQGAMGILVYFTFHEEYPMEGIYEAMSVINDTAHENADVKLGTLTSSDMPAGFVKATIIATGFEKEVVAVQNELSDESKRNSARAMELRGLLRISGADFESEPVNLDVPTYFRERKD